VQTHSLRTRTCSSEDALSSSLSIFWLGGSPAVRVGPEGEDLVMGAGRTSRAQNDVKTAFLNLTTVWQWTLRTERKGSMINDQKTRRTVVREGY
jgi:hypothetical protein